MSPKQRLPLHLFGINPDEMTLTVDVHVSIPVTLAFDNGSHPTAGEVYRAAIENFCDHPCLTAPADLLDSSYVDAVRPVMDASIDLRPQDCPACGGKGWLLAENSDHGLRIERCDECCEFDSDREAVQYVARIAAGEQP